MSYRVYLCHLLVLLPLLGVAVSCTVLHRAPTPVGCAAIEPVPAPLCLPPPQRQCGHAPAGGWYRWTGSASVAAVAPSPSALSSPVSAAPGSTNCSAPAPLLNADRRHIWRNLHCDWPDVGRDAQGCQRCLAEQGEGPAVAGPRGLGISRGTAAASQAAELHGRPSAQGG